jgi:hypothetical protein
MGFGCCGVAVVLTVPNLASAQEAAAKDEVFQLMTTVSIPGLASFDIGWVDAAINRYYLADRSNKSVDIISTNTSPPALVNQVIPSGVDAFAGSTGNNDTSGPNGDLTLINPKTTTRELWVGDGPTMNPACPASTPTCSTVKVFSIPISLPFNPSHVIPTNGVKRADELCFDSVDHLVLIANDADSPPYVSFISTDTYSVVGKISVPEATNGIEQCQWSQRSDLFYLNIPEVNGSGNDTADGNVYVISPKTMTVVDKFDIPTSKCAGPQGMAIGPVKDILLGCNAKGPPVVNGVGTGPQNSVIIKQNNGTVIAVLDNLGGADEVWFNPGDGHYFLADSSNAAGQQLGVVDSNSHQPDQTISVTSTAGAHSVAVDPNLNRAYLPVSNGVNVYAPSAPEN